MGWGCRSSAFDIQNFREGKILFCMLWAMGVDDSFAIENRAGREFVDTGRWGKNIIFRKMRQFLSIRGGGRAKKKVSSFLLFGHSHPCLKCSVFTKFEYVFKIERITLTKENFN